MTIEQTPSGNTIDIGGNVGPGAAISGQVSAQNIAGGDITIFQDMRPSERDARLQRLTDRLNAERQVLQQALATRPLPELSPYPGPRPYELRRHHQFFGRKELLDNLVGQISGNTDRLLILHGRPGVGKTSLVQAGLMPWLVRQGHLPFYIRLWRQPPTDAFFRIFPEDARPTDLLRHVLGWMTQTIGQPVLLILDQFENFFSHYLDDRQREEFILQLSECLNDPDLPVKFIFVIRSEQFASFNRFKEQVPAIFDHELEVPPLSRTQALEVIAGPLPDSGPTIAPDLAQAIVNDLDDHGIDPTPLQIVCDWLWDRAKSGQPLTPEIVLEQGEGHRGILSQYLQTLLTRHLKPQHQDLARAVLVSLLTGEKTTTTKSYRQLAHSLGDSPELQRVLENLDDLDLVSTELDSNGNKLYTLQQLYLAKVIALDAASIELKEADDLLNTGLRLYQRFRVPLAETSYQLIKRQVEKGALAITPEAGAMWQASHTISGLRHLIFRTLMTGLLGLLLAVPALSFSVILGSRSSSEDVLRLAVNGFIAMLFGPLINGLGAVAVTWLQYWRPHWHRWRLGVFIFLEMLPILLLGLGLTLLSIFGVRTRFSSPGVVMSLALFLGLFIGTALYFSLPPPAAKNWWVQIRSSLIAGPLTGLLMAAAIFALNAEAMDNLERVGVWIGYPIYLTTLTITFAFGLGVGDRLLLGPPAQPSQRAPE